MTELINKLKTLNELLDLPFDDLQSFDAIANTWQVNETIPIKASSNKLIKKTDKMMVFEVEILPSGTFPIHFHDCKEVCEVKEGVLMDPVLYPDQFFSKGDVYTVPALTKHLPKNASKSQPLIMTLKFTKII